MYYDAHTHFNDEKLYPQWETYLQHFIAVGGLWLVNVGVDLERSERAVSIAQQAQEKFSDMFVKATIGFHPSEVCFGKIPDSKSIVSAVQSLKLLYKENNKHIVAIGECGIDTHYEWDPHIAIQKELFAQQCELAKELDLPIVIHSRDDFASTWDVIKNYRDQKIYFHCRGYGPDEVKILQDHFSQLWIGFCGNISYPKAQILRDSLYVVRPESIVLETDAPYLAPQTRRWKTNEPAYVKEIYDYVASILSIDLPQLQSRLADNFQKLYNR